MNISTHALEDKCCKHLNFNSEIASETDRRSQASGGFYIRRDLTSKSQVDMLQETHKDVEAQEN